MFELVEVPESASAETFLPDSDDEGEYGGSSAPVEEVPKMLEDSDDESEAEADQPETPEPEPEPTVAPKKPRKIKRKKTTN